MSHAQVLPSYQRLRQVGLQLNNKLVKTLGSQVLREGGRKLGMFNNGTFIFGSEDESSVLLDFCIHNVWTDGLNALQRYVEQSPPEADSDESMLLTAKLEGYYSLFQIVEPEFGVGATVLDVLRGETRFLADMGFGSTARRGDIFASRVFPFEELGFLVSGGAALPVTGPTLSKIKTKLEQEFAPDTDFARLTPDRETELAALVIRICLESGMGEHIAYEWAAGTSSRREPSIDPREIRRANRNDPCPCGSGRKFKTCCRRRLPL